MSPAVLGRYRYTAGPTKEDRHLDYWGPTRTRVRNQLRRAAAEYDNDDFDDTFIEARNHRHHTAKGGYWD